MHLLKIATPFPLPSSLRAAGWEAVPLSQVGDGLRLAAVVGEAARPLPDDLPVFDASAVDWDVIAESAAQYEFTHVPAFLSDLIAFSETHPISFATPGHHAGHFFTQAPAGQAMLDHFGQTLFDTDISDSVDVLGDMLTHTGSPLAAERFAAEVYGVDEVYFVTNGTTTSNAICAAAALGEGDLVLFDRNNHRSLDIGALAMTGAKPVYLPTERNAEGMIGGVSAAALEETALRRAALLCDPIRGAQQRPFRLGVFQLDTYDGMLTQLPYLLAHVGALCDYLLLDGAWAGYEHFMPMLAAADVAKLTLGPDAPGILVTQSVHKTMAGLAQTSQILKQDTHLKGQARYIDHDHFNHAYLKFVTTSFSYPLYASVAVNAYVNQGRSGQAIWRDALADANWFRRQLKTTRLFRPFVPDALDGIPWWQVSDQTLEEAPAWRLDPDDSWHGFDGIAADQYLNDPMKVTIAFGDHMDPLPAPLVAAYLLNAGIIPEKMDLTTGLFLATPGSTRKDWQRLWQVLKQLEHDYDANVLVSDAIPDLNYGRLTLRQLATQMAECLEQLRLTSLLSKLFQADTWGEQVLTPRAADQAYVRGHCELIPLAEATGRIAAQGALPYPPGIFVVMPGERWSQAAVTYFQNLGRFMAAFPGFDFEIQGVQFDQHDQGTVTVLKSE